MAIPSFARKRLRVTFTLDNNAVFQGTNSNVLTLEGLRMIATMKMAGAPISPNCQLQIFGVRQADMNALSMLAWKPLSLQRNTLLLESNSGDGWVSIFQGNIIEGSPDYSSMPDVALRVQAVAGYFDKINPARPSSYPGAVDIADIVQSLASKMGRKFEGNDVHSTLTKPYFANTLIEQLYTACEAANIDVYLDQDVIALAYRGQPRPGQEVTLTKDTGLIGYPTIDKQGIQVDCLFNPALRFGGRVRVESELLTNLISRGILISSGEYHIYSLDSYLESEKPGGAWFSHLGCSEFGRTVIPQ